jgi:hypothetical protein
MKGRWGTIRTEASEDEVELLLETVWKVTQGERSPASIIIVSRKLTKGSRATFLSPRY